ncbi:MAG: copper chaperone PCu(A)C [Pseudomonadota bacterium]
MISPRRTLTGLALGLFATTGHAEVTVKEPWVAEAPPTAMALAGFMTLENTDASERHLVRADAPGFERVELHRSVEVDGVHRMQRQDSIDIPPNGSVELAPGGYHVMLIGVQEPKRDGDVIPLTLFFANGEEMTLSVPVKRRDFMK